MPTEPTALNAATAACLARVRDWGEGRLALAVERPPTGWQGRFAYLFGRGFGRAYAAEGRT